MAILKGRSGLVVSVSASRISECGRRCGVVNMFDSRLHKVDCCVVLMEYAC